MTVDVREAYLELLLEPVIIASTYMSDDARPLAEMTAPQRLRAGVPFEMRRCPYSGSRHGLPMNVSALRVLSLGMKATINDTIRLRRAYLARRGKQAFDLFDFWRFTRVLDSIPAYLVRRTENPLPDDCIPSRVSIMFKAAQGLHLAPEIMLLERTARDTVVTVESLISLIEERGLFLDEGRACAGPQPMVELFVRSAVLGEGKDLGDDSLFETLGEPAAAGLFDYADAVSDLFLAKASYEVESRRAVVSMLEVLGNGPLRQCANTHLQRFGFFRDRTPAELDATGVYFSKMTASSGELSVSEGVLPTRLAKMLRLRNPDKDPDQVERAADLLWRSVAVDRAWYARLETLQTVVVDALGGYSAPMPPLTSRLLGGSGYTSAEILADWLGVDIAFGADVCIVRAGSTVEAFPAVTF